jgi:hypothetical protein
MFFSAINVGNSVIRVQIVMRKEERDKTLKNVLFVVLISAANHPVFETSVQFWKVPKTGHFLKNFYEFYGV